MSSKESTVEGTLASAVRVNDEEEPDAKRSCVVHPLMRGVQSITDEFAGVPENPIWLKIACFMEQEERTRVFPRIPELKGIERLAEAQVSSLNSRRAIPCRRSPHRARYFVKNGDLPLLFPDDMKKFLEEVNSPNHPDRPKKPTLEMPGEEEKDWSPAERETLRGLREKTYEYLCKVYEFECLKWPLEFADRIEKALAGKEDLYSKESPMRFLDIADDDKELWFEWGADNASLDSTEDFHEFCAMAGVDPKQYYVEIVFNYCHEAPNVRAEFNHNLYMSYDRKVTFSTSFGYFGCTGIRPRSKRLFEWFKENGMYDEYCWNGRSFI